MTTPPATPAKRRKALVAALRADFPDRFSWDFLRPLYQSGCHSSGCAIGLARTIWPKAHSIRHATAGDLGDYIGLTHREGWNCFGLDDVHANYGCSARDVTPQMVADKIEELSVKRS